MTKRKSVRTIKVSEEAKKKLANLFNCTERMVYKALCFESETELARKIQHVALHELGGIVMVNLPEHETIHDEQNGTMVQTFGNGAVLTVDKHTGDAKVEFKGVVRQFHPNISIRQLYVMQEFAAAF